MQDDNDAENIATAQQTEDEDMDNTNSAQKPLTETRKRKMQPVHQVIYFNVHNGTRRTPLHLMNAQSIHEIKYQIKSNNFYLTSERVKTIKHKP